MTFKSIEDLQQQNQRLLAVVRELSEEKESEEMETLDQQTQVSNLLWLEDKLLSNLGLPSLPPSVSPTFPRSFAPS